MLQQKKPKTGARKPDWQAMWATGTVNQSMHGGIVSDVYARRLYFDCGGVIYYIPIKTTKIFPKLDATSTYATGVTLYTPWMEGDSSTLARAYVELVTYAKSITTEETVKISYRTDRTN
ncbi:MAG: hypothetical protein ABIL06_21195, partial [Pseudomonadota bacterium]